MSRKNSNKRYTKAQIQARIEAKKKAKRLAMQKHITIFTLLALLIIGLVSTTFASFTTPAQTGDSGSLVAQIKTNAVNNGNKDHIAPVGSNVDNADTKANVDVAETGLSCTFVFDNSSTKFSNPQIMIGHGSWSEGYLMTQISNTQLWYYSVSGWNDATQIGIMDNASKWGSEGNSVSHRFNYAPAGKTSVVSISGSLSGTQLLVGSSLSRTSYTSYSSLNTTQTAQAQYSAAGSSSYTNGTTGGTTTVSSTRVNSSWGSTATTDGLAARTATVTMTATANTGYNFVGWYNSSGTQVSTNTSYSYTCSGSAATYYARFDPKTYTISYNANGGSGSVANQTKTHGTALTLKSSGYTRTNYTLANWNTKSDGTGTTYALGASYTNNAAATLYAMWRPNAPTALTLTASNVAENTTGNGTQANPYIVFKSGGFGLTATATVPTGSVGRYCATSNGTYSDTNTFSPSTATIAANTSSPLSYTVYAKSYLKTLYSSSYKSATAYYLVFNHLNGANTGFTMSSNSITDIETVTFTPTEITGIETAEMSHITQSYQVSTNGTTFTDFTGNSWTPDNTGTYSFRIKTTNNTTKETVYSAAQTVTVTQSTVYYTITTNKASGSGSCSVALKTGDTAITNNQILSNEPLTISVTRTNATPSNYYIKSITVTDGTTSWSISNHNGNLAETLVIEHVKGDVTITYNTAIKPYVQPNKPANSQAVTFKYYKDGTLTTVSPTTTATTYYVDYNSSIEYTVKPSSGYYVSAFTGVTLKSGSSWSSDQSIGTKANIIENVGTVTAAIIQNKTVTVNNTDNVSGASLTIAGETHSFGDAVSLNYGVSTEVIVTPPQGYYAVVTKTSGVDISPSILTDGKAKFNVTLKGESSVYGVKFIANPKIYITQPQYGSIYITDDTGRYYFNGESVGYGTKLTVNVKKDNQSNTVTSVKINGTQIGTADGSTFNIIADSTATADISLLNGYDNFESTLAYGYRRIFFTDSRSWGSDVTAHVSNTFDDRDFSKNNFGMTLYYTNDYNQNVYYCDIPYDKKYVVFFDYGTQTRYTATATIDNQANAFYAETGSSPFPIGTWTQYYSDYVAVDRATSIQQASTSKNEPVTFKYTCDFGDKVLSAEVVAGNACTFDFDSGDLIITPTESTHDVSLVKVTSSITKTVKYYLIRVANFEITDFSGIRKIYSTTVINNIQLQTILNGGVLNYLAKYFVSDTGAEGSYVLLGESSNGENSYDDTLEGYLNNFTLNYAANSISASGTKFYKVTAQDNSGKTATAYQRTLFGTNSHIGERCMYFLNNTTVDISKYDLRVCFLNTDGEQIWSTMQKVGETDYYRVTIPKGYESKVNIYIAKKNRFTNSIENMRLAEYCAYRVENAPVPAKPDYSSADTSSVANDTSKDYNIVYNVNAINTEGIHGEFVKFN